MRKRLLRQLLARRHATPKLDGIPPVQPPWSTLTFSEKVIGYVVLLGLLVGVSGILAWLNSLASMPYPMERPDQGSARYPIVSFNQAGDYQAEFGAVGGEKGHWPVSQRQQGLLNEKFDDGTCSVMVGQMPKSGNDQDSKAIFVRLPCDELTLIAQY